MISANSHRPMFVVSFYSYKGGVGRSVALMNTAQQLASSGRKVLLLDLDLEAPGLHSACEAAWPKALKRNQPGFTDFFEKYLDRLEEPPAINRYISAPFGPNMLIQLIPAGNLSKFNEYSSKLLRINEHLLDPATSARELLLKVRDDLGKMGFDYLLIDSRTGHTDILGATTILLPHLVVFVSNLSQQSLQGTREVMDWVKKASDAAVKKHLSRDVALNRFFLRSVNDPAIQILVIASPVPLGDYSALAEAESKNGLGRPFDHVIYYVPQIAAHEDQHVAQTIGDDPVHQYRSLTDKIRVLNPFEPSTLVDYGFQSLERQDWIRALSYFDAAEHFLDGNGTKSDKGLTIRRKYGEIRALALGFQTEKARQQLESLEGEEVPEGLEGESLAANLQLVRGHLASNQLLHALKPAERAVRQAITLSERRGRTDPWEVVARLQLGEVHSFLGDMDKAKDAVQQVPIQAEVLNRGIERVKALQLLANASASMAQFANAENTLDKAIETANGLGVGYLIAGCAFVRAVIDLARGRLSQENAKLLEDASNRYAHEGDGLSAADCLTELAIYRHRLGSAARSAEIGRLQTADKLYNEIAGTKLGQVSVLLYVAEIQFDHLQPRARTPREKDEFSGSLEALAHASRIATEYKLPKAIRTDIEVWIDLLEVLTTPSSSSGPENSNSDLDVQSLELTLRTLPRERNRTLRAFLLHPSRRNLRCLEAIADKAEGLETGYNEAIARTLVALGGIKLDDARLCDTQIQRIRHLVHNGKLSWSIWGHIHNISKIEVWKKPASVLLCLAQEGGFKIEPVRVKVDEHQAKLPT